MTPAERLAEGEEFLADPTLIRLRAEKAKAAAGLGKAWRKVTRGKGGLAALGLSTPELEAAEARALEALLACVQRRNELKREAGR